MTSTLSGSALLDLPARLPQRRRLVTAVPGPGSAALAERRSRAVSAGVASSVPVYAVDADAGIVLDVDGNALVDLGSGIAVTTVGASAPEVTAAVAEAAAHFTHTCFMVTPYEGYVAVCERLAALTPGDHPKKTALFTSGSEAVENAVKIARRATGREAVVTFDHAYHGRTNLALALTAKAAPYKQGFGPYAAEIYRVPPSYPLRDLEGMTGEEAARRAIDRAAVQVGADRIAAVLYEPIQGEGGFIAPAPGFVPALAAWCREHGIVFVADEVQAGLARTGDWFACDHEGVVPDLVCVAKGIAGGMPLSAVVGRADLLDVVQPGGLGGTYGGNPVACAAALAALEVMERDDLPSRARGFERVIREVLEPVAAESPHVAELRGRGAMMALEFVRPGGLEPDPGAVRRVVAECLAQGVIVLSCGTWGNCIRLLPPVVMPERLLRDALGVLAGAIRAL